MEKEVFDVKLKIIDDRFYSGTRLPVVVDRTSAQELRQWTVDELYLRLEFERNEILMAILNELREEQ